MLKNKTILVHFIAMLCAILGFYLIYKISCFLYFPEKSPITIYQYAQLLWATRDGYFRFLLMMNFIIKPLFIYYLVWALLEWLFDCKK